MNRPRITFDTNIFISIARNLEDIERNAMLSFVYNECDFVVLAYIIKELREKAQNPKFSQQQVKNIQTIASLLEHDPGITVLPTSKYEDEQLKSLIRDPKDYPILLTCNQYQIRYLISGDMDFITLTKKLQQAGIGYPIALTEKIFREYYPDDIWLYQACLVENSIEEQKNFFQRIRKAGQR